jgi:short-chain fatty acids transporter
LIPITCICGFAYIIYYFWTKGTAGINLDSINFTFFIFGLAFWGRPTLFVRAILEGVKGAASIIVQFPFYAGIMGIFMFSGLSKVIAMWIVSVATPLTFPWFSFVAACIVNIFVPSAGGEWMVIGPTLLEAGKSLGYPVGKLIMAYSYGDMCTNLIQPFWSLLIIPVLAKMANIRSRDIMGYTAVLCLVWFVVLSVLVVAL